MSFENLGFDSWDREFLFGGTNLQGVSYSKFNNLYGTHIGVRAYDFINSVSVWIDNLYGYFSGSGFRMADDLDSSTYGSTTNSYVGDLQFTLKSFAAEGIVLEATAMGAGGSQLNEISGELLVCRAAWRRCSDTVHDHVCRLTSHRRFEQHLPARGDAGRLHEYRQRIHFRSRPTSSSAARAAASRCRIPMVARRSTPGQLRRS